jgi:hypothetical protein
MPDTDLIPDLRSKGVKDHTFFKNRRQRSCLLPRSLSEVVSRNRTILPFFLRQTMSPTWRVEGRDREKVDDLHFAHLWLAQALGEKYILSPIRTELTKSGTSGYFTINAIGCAFYEEREIRYQRQDQGPLATAIQLHQLQSQQQQVRIQPNSSKAIMVSLGCPSKVKEEEIVLCEKCWRCLD